MPIRITQADVTAIGPIPLDDFPHLAEVHLRCVPGRRNAPNTRELEEERRYLRQKDFPHKHNLIEPSIRGVCRWGGYAGIAGRVLPPKNSLLGFDVQTFKRQRMQHYAE